jgi:hypothetical protein
VLPRGVVVEWSSWCGRKWLNRHMQISHAAKREVRRAKNPGNGESDIVSFRL